MGDYQQDTRPSSALYPVTLKYALVAFLLFVFISLVMGGPALFYGPDIFLCGVASQVLISSVILIYMIGSFTTIGKPLYQLIVFWFTPCITIIFIISGSSELLAQSEAGWLISLFLLAGMSAFLWLPFFSQRYYRWLHRTFVGGSRNPKPVTINSWALKIAMTVSVISAAIGQNMDDWFGVKAEAYVMAGVVWFFGYGTFFILTVGLLVYTNFYSGLVDQD